VQRIGPDLPETIIALNAETGRVFLDGTRKIADVEQMAAEIATALRGAGKPLTEAELEELVEGRTALKRATLRHMVEREQASRTGKGGKGDPYRYSIPVSCSLVPIKKGEQAFSPSLLDASVNKQASHSCSHVPVRVLVPDVPETQEEPLPAWVTEPEPPDITDPIGQHDEEEDVLGF
jgi:hypothetical protein